MNVDFLLDYFVPVIAGLALCVCAVIRLTTEKLDRYIPLIAAAIGFGCSVWIYYPNVGPSEVLMGLFSGLAATGLYEAFKQLIFKKVQ